MKIVKKCIQCKSSFNSEHWAKRKFCSHVCSTLFNRGEKRIFTKDWKRNINEKIINNLIELVREIKNISHGMEVELN